MARDRLFLIEPCFPDPKRLGSLYVCPHCNQIEGLLAAFPRLAAGLEVERVPFARPRRKVIEVLGEENQSLPVLVFGNGNPPADAERYQGIAFVTATRRIIDLLAERHGFPRLHD
ncbi:MULTISPECIES: DUF3088 domain-containing protein [unclassified Mesorhizobium]|uniref:DUF3088 domain-containing protein n=1 Tax=unclassified Mesorhizobium TaxID=325217 RepID=UPI000FCA2FA9|nr:MULTISPECIES: DUF3088 domain-containing protein [unclassified Mesorhizobium]RUW28726.1 DUF3088 domain-containing protein [Mesorhizobium sp. M1E.F.Ca.ET.041.01.1.1]RWD91844.1 MAG: DUF3088 domain-containing protein [Mesorhizobium sp.]RWD95799.1 MAG: DUF3088 domain-containing protein [Mesorhizobium sp.]